MQCYLKHDKTLGSIETIMARLPMLYESVFPVEIQLIFDLVCGISKVFGHLFIEFVVICSIHCSVDIDLEIHVAVSLFHIIRQHMDF